MAKEKKKVDLCLIAPDLIYTLDKKWVNLREEILDGRVDPLDGLRLFQCCVEATIRAIDDKDREESVSSASSMPQFDRVPVIDLGEDSHSDEEFLDSSPTEPRLLARVDLQRILRVVDEAAKRETRPKDFDPIEDWRAEMQRFYENYGFHFEVPRPEASREELADWRADGWELLFRPAEKVASYEQLMRAFGHSEHWTLRLEEMGKISWEPAADGYWFLAEAREGLPRAGKSYDDYVKEVPVNHQLLCLEEYSILWHVMKDTLGMILDLDGHTLLRTQFGLSEVLFARSNIDKTTVEFIIRGWAKKINFKKMGTRYCRQIPSSA